MMDIVGGLCFAHGEYTGQICPQWPKCATDPQPFKPKAEPREPAAREGQVAKTSGQLITGILNEWIRCFISSPSAEQIRWAIDQTEAYSAELRAQIAHLQQFPPALNDVLKRAEVAESALKDQTFWADQYHKAAIAAEAQVEQLVGDIHAISGDYSDEKAKREAAERSLEQAREALQGIQAECFNGSAYTTFINASAALKRIRLITIELASTSVPEGTV